MKQKLQRMLMALCAVTLFLACSKDDDPVTPPTTENGGETFQAKVVTVAFPAITLSQFEYQGTFNGAPITLTRSDEHNLVFMIPVNTIPGDYELIIPALDNAAFQYQVKETVLSGTAEVTMADFINNLETFSQMLDESPEGIAVQSTIDSFNSYWTDASAMEKTEMALVYKANKSIFDSLLLSDTGGRFIVAGTEIYISKHVAAVALVGIGIATLAGAPVVGCVVIGAAGYKAYKANADAIDHVYNAITVEVGGWFGLNDRNTNSDDLILIHNQAATFNFNLSERKLIASDAAKTEPLAVQYFNAYNQYNHFADQANEKIENINSAKGTEFSELPSEQLPASSPAFSTTVTPEIYENVQLSFSHPNVQLVSASVAEDGVLAIKAKIVGIPASLPIQTQLLYSYSDGLSTFTGKLPVTVAPSVIGTWTLESFENGTPIGTYFNYAFAEDCSTLALAAYTITNESYSISESAYSYTGNEITRQYNLSWSGCNVLSNGPDQDESFPYSGSGTYTIVGGTYIAVEGGETHALAFEWLTPDKIKIDDKVYVRN